VSYFQITPSNAQDINITAIQWITCAADPKTRENFINDNCEFVHSTKLPNSTKFLVETNIKAVIISYSKQEYKGEFTRLGWHIQEYNSLLLVYIIIYFSYFEPEENRTAWINGSHMLQCERSIRPDSLCTPFNPGANNGYTMPLLLEGWKWIILYCCADYWKGQIIQRVLLTLQQTLLNSQSTASMQQAASKLCSYSQICNLACW